VCDPGNRCADSYQVRALGREKKLNLLGLPSRLFTTASRLFPVTPMNDLTCILSAIEQGDPHAAEQLLPLVYDELRRLAAARLAQEKPGQTLQATALVHEAYIRLVDGDKAQHWSSRGHFFAAAAEAMRRILVDRARQRHSQRRGGAARRQPLEGLHVAAPARDEEVLAVDEALQRLQQLDPPKADLVKLRYFAGLTIPEAAQVLGISIPTANRYWAYARAWLHEELAGGDESVAP
jgi:RNA polymerase sigma factor (TIGR02999 family)